MINMIDLESNMWYIVREDREEGGWIFSQAYSLLDDCKIALGTDSFTRDNGLYRHLHDSVIIGQGAIFIANGFVMDNSRQEKRY